ncbi:MAG: creatininase family protein, partial [Pirellulales bacterium]|nr:creatininase family protein [Pirellulales bacterium]
VIVPVAATEQHGKHLPVGTDSMTVEVILHRLETSFDGRLLIVPTLTVGCSEHHMSFPGTLTLSHETFRRWVADVVDSIARNGFRRIVLLNSHGGNSAICAVLGEQLGQRYPQIEILVTTWWSAAAERLRKIQDGSLGSVGHACEFETSIIQAIAPDRVDISAQVDDGIQHPPESMHFDMLHGPAASCYRPFDKLSRTGVFGSPSLASAEKGERILTETIAALRELITEFWSDWQ